LIKIKIINPEEIKVDVLKIAIDFISSFREDFFFKKNTFEASAPIFPVSVTISIKSLIKNIPRISIKENFLGNTTKNAIVFETKNNPKKTKQVMDKYNGTLKKNPNIINNPNTNKERRLIFL